MNSIKSKQRKQGTLLFFKDYHDDDISSMSQVPNQDVFPFGNNSANQTVPDNNFNRNNNRGQP